MSDPNLPPGVSLRDIEGATDEPEPEIDSPADIDHEERKQNLPMFTAYRIHRNGVSQGLIVNEATQEGAWIILKDAAFTAIYCNAHPDLWRSLISHTLTEFPPRETWQTVILSPDPQNP